MVRAGCEGNSCTLELWVGNRVTTELVVPKKQHGSVYNDGWFGSGAAWSPDESRLAYVAEVTAYHTSPRPACQHWCTLGLAPVCAPLPAQSSNTFWRENGWHRQSLLGLVGPL